MIEPLGRNEPCPCGSGRKFKRCCGQQGPAAPTPPSPEPARTFDDPETWSGWGYDRAAVQLLLSAAGECFAAAPWAAVQPDQPIFLGLPDGREWLLSCNGPAGQHDSASVQLFEQPEDYFALIAETSLAEPPLSGQLHTLWFDRRDQLGPLAQRELLAHGWPYTRGAGWPMVTVDPPPGADPVPLPAATLASCWRATLAFIRQHRPLLSSGKRPTAMVELIAPDTEIVCSYDGVLGDTWDAIWPVPEHLEPALPEGPAARPAAAYTLRDPETLAAEMLATVRLFEQRLLADGSERSTIPLDVENLERMSGMLAESGVPWAAFSELDLRIFLYLDAFDPDAGFSDRGLEALPRSLERFCAFLMGEGIGCAWAFPILADTNAFAERWDDCPTAGADDAAVEAWVVRLMQDLVDRALLLPHPDWPAETGPAGQALEVELTRRVLDWRDAIIHAGVTRPAAVIAALEQRRLEWQETPLPGFQGRTPMEVLRAGE